MYIRLNHSCSAAPSIEKKPTINLSFYDYWAPCLRQESRFHNTCKIQSMQYIILSKLLCNFKILMTFYRTPVLHSKLYILILYLIYCLVNLIFIRNKLIMEEGGGIIDPTSTCYPRNLSKVFFSTQL